MIAADAVAKSRDIIDILGTTGAVAVIGSIVIAVLTLGMNALATRRRERRERYETITETLAAWSELPFRIRRRTSNDQGTVAMLVSTMSDLQERFVRDKAYLRGECQWLADRRDQAQRELQETTGPWIKEAWTTAPASSTDLMNLNGWGPTDAGRIISDFSCDLRWRFGFRRVVNPGRRLVMWLWTKLHRR